MNSRRLLLVRKLILTLIVGSFLWLSPQNLQALQNQDRFASKEIHRMSIDDLQEMFYKAEIEKKISLNINGKSVGEALKHVAAETGLKLTYRGDIITDKKVTLQSEGLSVSDALRHILDGTGLEYQLSKDGYLLINRAYVDESVSEVVQQTVRGGVSDAESGESLPGVNILLKGTSTGTTTNIDGLYELSVSSMTDTLVFSYVGYQTVEIPINGRNELNIELQAIALTGQDVVVIGYGTQRSQDLTGSVGTINIENVESMPVTSPDGMLLGQIPGVEVTTSTGLPGSAPRIQVRGIGNLGAGGQPLFVVDGFALPQPSSETAARMRNPLADIPPDDIQSITVLKDASATAIYGSRAANGVVLIETKKGQIGAPQVSISASTGIQNDIDWMTWDMANARQFAEFQNYIWTERVRNGEASEVPSEYRNPGQYGEGTDWFRLLRRSNAPMHNMQASVSGGNETVRSFFSAGFQQQDGIVEHTQFRRFNFRANLEANLSDRFDVGINFAPSFTQRNLPDAGEDRGSAIGAPMMMSPLQPAYDENGKLCPYPSQCSDGANTGTWTHANPLYRLQALDEEFSGVRVIGSAFLNYEFIDGFSLRTSFNVDWGNSERNYFNPSTLGGINAPPPTVPQGSYDLNRDISYLSETTLNVEQEVGPGSLSAIAGVTAQTGYGFESSFSGDFPDDEIRTLNVASDIEGESEEAEWSLLSVLGRVNYNLYDKYIFTGTVRSDGSSRFGSENRWGTFPSGAVAWNLSNEPFMEGTEDLFNELKLRLSYGLTGNNQIGNYSALGTVIRDDYLYGTSVAGGRRLDSMANPQLGWERTSEWNAGLDAALLDHRVTVTFDVFERITKDLLLERDLPTSSGFDEVTENLGSMRNRGVDFSVSTININRQDLVWSTDFNLSLYRNEILSLPGDEPIFVQGGEGHPSHETRVGQPIGMFIGYVFDGIYQNEAEIEQYPSFDGAVPGNMRWRDVNGDGEINPGQREVGGDFAIIGNPHPDFTFGLTNSLRIGRFDIRAVLTGRVGGDVYRREFFRTALNIDGLFNVSADYVEGFWRSEEDPGSGIHPTPLGGGEARRRYRGEHTLNVEDGSNLWLRNAMVRYNLPTGFAGMRNASVYVSAQNLFVLTGYPGNPESQRNLAGNAGTTQLGVDWLNYPLARQFMFGIELNL